MHCPKTGFLANVFIPLKRFVFKKTRFLEMVFEKKMSVRDLIEQMREELKQEQEEAGIVSKPKKESKKKMEKAKKKIQKKPAKKKKKK